MNAWRDLDKHQMITGVVEWFISAAVLGVHAMTHGVVQTVSFVALEVWSGRRERALFTVDD